MKLISNVKKRLYALCADLYYETGIQSVVDVCEALGIPSRFVPMLMVHATFVAQRIPTNKTEDNL